MRETAVSRVLAAADDRISLVIHAADKARDNFCLPRFPLSLRRVCWGELWRLEIGDDDGDSEGKGTARWRGELHYNNQCCR